MKKIFITALIALSALVFNSCTDGYRTRMLGGTMTITVPRGYKVVEATWKEACLWYMIEPAEPDYKPKTKEFIEDSRYGIAEGKVIFIESK